MRLFRLFRKQDVSGCSGVGLVAEMCVFSSGKVAVSFLPGKARVTSVSVFESIADAQCIHGHEGLTEIVPVSTRDYAGTIVDAERDEWGVAA